MKKKTAAIIVASALLLIAVVGGTLAWLTDTTEEVKNTFTVGDIDITLAETKTDFKMIPGCTIEKDPKVTVVKGSEKCYVFVKLEKSENFDTFMTYEIADGWTKLTDVDNVWYREVNASDADQSFDVLKDNQVKVKEEVTKAQLDALTQDTYPTLTITAYACQYNKSNNANFTPAEAWNNAQPTTTP